MRPWYHLEVSASALNAPPAMLEFLAEGSGTGFLQKKWVPDGLLGAPFLPGLILSSASSGVLESGYNKNMSGTARPT